MVVPHPITLFYEDRLGLVAQRLVRSRVMRIWPHGRGLSMLGLGHAGPYLAPFAEAGRTVVAGPLLPAPARFPAVGPGLACATEEDSLPFADLSFDRVLLVHGIEAAENARRLLREAWRVLKDDGRLIVVAPNRRGWWAYADHTPFGQGQPYSPGQIGRLLEASLFRVELRDTALFVPPTSLRLVLRGAAVWEATGRMVAPQFAGVTITEATKDLYGAVPAGAVRVRRRLVFTAAR